MSASAIIETIIALVPLIEKVAGYIVGDHDELPDVPLVLKSDIELLRLKERLRRVSTMPPS